MTREWLIVVVAAAVIAQLFFYVRDRGWVPVGSVRALREAEVTYVEDRRLFVVAMGSQFVALSAVSPHGPGPPEPVLFCPISGWFVEKYHGAKWDRNGIYAGGPASRGLSRVPVRMADGTVEVFPARVLEGPPRGRPYDEPAGPFCDEDPVAEAEPGFAASSSEAR